ncbi:MAG: MFS transporter [Desulfomonile tiedjei]|nr:MFS transporter [Desulfomonile tiedjei]
MNLNKKLILISLLYFAEGFPFGIIADVFPIYFKIHGMSLASLGLLSLVSLPYALKFLWAPAVDFLGCRRHWIAAAQFLLAGLLLAILAQNPSNPDFLLWACIAALAIVSATQDIAVDAYSIEMLDASEVGLANGFRQATYRLAMILAGGIFVALGGWIGWEVTFGMAAAILLCLSIVSFRLPAVETARPAFSLSALAAPFKDLLERPGVTQVVLFILLYKLGDLAMAPIVRPFWLDRGLSTTEIGLINGTLGVIAAIAGGLAGGIFMARYGVFHGLWFLGLWQTVTHLAYVVVAAYPETGHAGVYAASIAESFCSGLGTTAFLAFLMSICNKEFSATQYAILSALFRMAGIMVGAVSGWTTDMLGYAHYFAICFLLPLPSFAFMLHARAWLSRPTSSGGSSEEEELRYRVPTTPRERLPLAARSAQTVNSPGQAAHAAANRQRAVTQDAVDEAEPVRIPATWT